MTESLIATLSQETQRQLKLCGITTDAQLAASSAVDIYRELQTAGEFFPDEKIELTEQEIYRLTEQARNLLGVQDSPIAKLQEPEAIFAQSVSFNAQEEKQPGEQEKVSEEEKRKFHGQLRAANVEKKEKKPITSGHPFSLFIGALATMLVPFFLISLIAFPALLLLSDFLPLDNNQIAYAVIIFALILPYLLMVRLVHCSVCHMNIFTFRNYPHHSKAHRFPLLGVPISTALRIVFCWSFTCPSCGTTQKLIGKGGQRHHHSRRK